MRGFGILPSRAMKKINSDYSDWGEGKIRESCDIYSDNAYFNLFGRWC